MNQMLPLLVSLLSTPAFAQATGEFTLFECQIEGTTGAKAKLTSTPQGALYAEYKYYEYYTQEKGWEELFSTYNALAYLGEENGGAMEYYRSIAPGSFNGDIGLEIKVDFGLNATGKGAYYGENKSVTSLVNCTGYHVY